MYQLLHLHLFNARPCQISALHLSLHFLTNFVFHKQYLLSQCIHSIAALSINRGSSLAQYDPLGVHLLCESVQTDSFFRNVLLNQEQ